MSDRLYGQLLVPDNLPPPARRKLWKLLKQYRPHRESGERPVAVMFYEGGVIESYAPKQITGSDWPNKP